MAVVTHVGQVLMASFGAGWHARLQGPLALDDDSEPEPDVAIVAGRALNLVDRVLEVHREPGSDVNAALGAFYRSVEILRAGATVTPLAAPGARIAIADLLPPA